MECVLIDGNLVYITELIILYNWYQNGFFPSAEEFCITFI